jgi:hypothetical protein
MHDVLSFMDCMGLKYPTDYDRVKNNCILKTQKAFMRHV